MVDFHLTPDEQRIIRDLDAFLESEVLPVMEANKHRYDTDAGWLNPDGSVQPDVLEVSRDIRRRSAKAGFYALHLPKEVGGLGMSYCGYLQANKTVFRHGLGLTLAVLAAIEGPNKMLLNLDEEHQKRWLHPLIRGEKTTCFALTEPTAGSDVRNIQTTATKDGNDWIINGSKIFITNGPYADFAQVFAKTSNEGGMGDITAFIVERDTPGFQTGPMLETVANNGLPCELHFNNVRIPEENIIGGIGEGFYHALQNINDTRIQNGGMAIGLAQHCLDKTLGYLTTRTAFGKPIGKYQGVSFQMADSLTELRAAEMISMYAAWKIDQGEDAIQETSMTKLYSTEMLWNVADRCIQAHGAIGTLRRTGIERILRWARVMRIWEGTSEIQRMTIAKTMGL
ncbi:MAG TPA: acyl-CoA dehydrogenase family protein [Candidatus Thermoplasmatota archaeon]|nr:acyl-CoA dehydrogenase family protein [Candidatus Thermoplasmatota archaeon]